MKATSPVRDDEHESLCLRRLPRFVVLSGSRTTGRRSSCHTCLARRGTISRDRVPLRDSARRHDYAGVAARPPGTGRRSWRGNLTTGDDVAAITSSSTSLRGPPGHEKQKRYRIADVPMVASRVRGARATTPGSSVAPARPVVKLPRLTNAPGPGGRAALPARTHSCRAAQRYAVSRTPQASPTVSRGPTSGRPVPRQQPRATATQAQGLMLALGTRDSAHRRLVTPRPLDLGREQVRVVATAH